MTPSAPATFRSPLLSLFQSAVQHLAESLPGPGRAEAMVRAAADVAAVHLAGMRIPTTPPPSSLGDLWTCARLGLGYLEARLRDDDAMANRLRNELIASPCDPGWPTALETYLAYFGPGGTRREIPYIHPSAVGDHVITASTASRVALISDWGTGSPTAEMLLRQVAALRPDVLIHLGDIYYSGTERECDRHFRRLIDEVLGPRGQRIPVFTLSGNHDMYSGGEGYYALIRGLNPGGWAQPASFFCVRDDAANWQILAMDTGLHDHDPFSEFGSAETFLDPHEEEWHLARLHEFAGSTIMLSHHPVFSAFRRIGGADSQGRVDPVNRALAGSLRRFQSAGRIAAWFWGHEHNLCVYQPYAGLDRGRCVGNGAIPVFVRDQPYRPLDGVADPPRLMSGTELGNNGTVMHHGFTVLTFDAPGGATAFYYEQDRATPLYVEPLYDTA